MAFWGGYIRSMRICSNISNLVRWYSQSCRVITQSDCQISRILFVHDLRRPAFFVYQPPKEIGARFFAAAVQAKVKPAVKDPKGLRLNGAITARTIRLVTDEGHSILSRQEALNLAAQLNLDLVEVQRFSNPPVCKIMDYHKERYKQQLKEKDRVKHKLEGALRNNCKEVRFSMKIEQKDLQLKANTAIRLMERGYRVKCMAMGKEEENLGELLSRIMTLIEDVAFIESGPRLEKFQAFAVVRHIKFGLPKKAGKKTVTTMVTGNNEIEEVALSPVMAVDVEPLQNQVEIEHMETTSSESDFEDANLSEEFNEPSEKFLEMPLKAAVIEPEENWQEQDSWSSLESSGTYDQVFSFNNDRRGQHKHDNRAALCHENVMGTSGISQNPRPSREFERQKFNLDPCPLPQGPPYQRKSSPQPIERDWRSNDDQPRKTFENSSVTNMKHLHPPEMDKNSDTKLGAKFSSYGIFSSPKPVDMNNQQPPNSINGNREASLQNPKTDVSNQTDNGQDRWGIFSKQSSGPNQRRPMNIPHNIQRRERYNGGQEPLLSGTQGPRRPQSKWYW